MADIHRRRTDGEKSGRGMLAFRCRKSLDFSNAKVPETSVLGTRKRETDVGLSPPEKATTPELPERYALLESFYEGVEVAVSLLDIRRQLCTFQAVCATVEATTKRRFLQKHLAQIKYILPEAIQLEYVRSYDADTRSNKWELKISLLPLSAEAEEPSQEGEGAAKKPKIETVQRRRAFHARLVKFASTHAEEDDVPAHPMPERVFNATSATSEFSMPVATTCIPMEINTAAHRVETPKSPALSSHFSKSFNSCFSLKAGGSFIRNAKPAHQKPAHQDTILSMPINRTPHRDIHNVAEIPTGGTSHLAASFKPFFSLKRTSPELEVIAEDFEDSAPVLSGQQTPLKRKHEEPEIVEPVELQTPIKIIRSIGTPAASEFESPNMRPHFPHFSASSSVPKPPVSKDVPVSFDVRTPGRVSDAVDHCDEQCSGLETPVKSSIPGNPFKSPTPVTPKHHHTPCTPQVSERGESSVYVSYHASQPGSALKSPAATPVRQGSAIRSLFGTPKRDSRTSPGMDVPCTPGVNPSRGSRFRNKEEARQNLGSLFARSGCDDTDCGDGGESSSCITTEKSTLRKSLSFASESTSG